MYTFNLFSIPLWDISITCFEYLRIHINKLSGMDTK